jgi:hypothetical protein
MKFSLGQQALEARTGVARLNGDSRKANRVPYETDTIRSGGIRVGKRNGPFKIDCFVIVFATDPPGHFRCGCLRPTRDLSCNIGDNLGPREPLLAAADGGSGGHDSGHLGCTNV